MRTLIEQKIIAYVKRGAFEGIPEEVAEENDPARVDKVRQWLPTLSDDDIYRVIRACHCLDFR